MKTLLAATIAGVMAVAIQGAQAQQCNQDLSASFSLAMPGAKQHAIWLKGCLGRNQIRSRILSRGGRLVVCIPANEPLLLLQLGAASDCESQH